MKAEEKAVALCDKIGLTDEKERYWFIRGYCHGATETELAFIDDALETLKKQVTIPHETR